MTPRTLFTIIIKIFGLSIIYNLIDTIPTMLRKIPNHMNNNSGLLIFIIISTLILAFYFFASWALLFKSRWIIDKLSLDKNFNQEIINIQTDGISVIQIAIIVISVLMLAYSLPALFSDLVLFYKLQNTPDISNDQTILLSFNKIWGITNFSLAIFNTLKIILGILLLKYNKRLSRWIESKKTEETTDNL